MIGDWERFPTPCVGERAETLIMAVGPDATEGLVGTTCSGDVAAAGHHPADDAHRGRPRRDIT
jgi:hypothetical protein